MTIKHAMISIPQVKTWKTKKKFDLIFIETIQKLKLIVKEVIYPCSSNCQVVYTINIRVAVINFCGQYTNFMIHTVTINFKNVIIYPILI